jgi:hypothetical protein
MATFHTQPAQPLAADGAALTHVLNRAGVSKHSLVRVTGPAGPIAMLWLNQHGYQRAVYAPASRVATMAPADALLVPHSCGAKELAELLQGGECLHEGGILIVQTAAAGSVEGVDSIPATLEAAGFAVQTRLSDRGRDIYIARRSGLGGFKLAA